MSPFTFKEIAAVLRHEDGALFWLDTMRPKLVGKPAGRPNGDGYLSVGYRRRTLLAHRVVWLLEHGEWPPGMLDHIDGNKQNNHPSNLRIATQSQNQQNRKPSGALGLKGVTKTPSGKFQAACGNKYLGLHSTAEAAARAYDAEALQQFGQFARLNFPEVAHA